MIIVNHFRAEDYNPDTDGYDLILEAVVNDKLDLLDDIDKLVEALDNEDFEFKNGTFYEIHFDRAIIYYSHPASERCFHISKIFEYDYNSETGQWTKPLIDLS